MKDFLPAQEVKNLKAAHRIERDRKRADRIKTILFLDKGFTYPQIAQLLMLDETTIPRYEKEYQKTGAPYNHNKQLQAYLKKHPRIEVFYLPPYSPNLNS